jgi:hypothetical protein
MYMKHCRSIQLHVANLFPLLQIFVYQPAILATIIQNR